MANPQVENGFTRIANEILEVIQQYKFNLNELKVIMCIWRYTYGFNRAEHALSLSFFEKHTGLSRGRVNKSLKDLLANKVISVTDKGNAAKSNSYSFNKNYEEWTNEKYASFTSVQDDTSSQNDTSIQDDTATSVRNDTATSVQDDTATSVQDDTQERKIKEISKETSKERVDDGFSDKPNPFREYEKHFGPFPMGTFLSQLNDWIDNSQFQQPEAIICEVIKRAKLNAPKNPPRYIQSILVSLEGLGLFTLKAVQDYNEKHDQKVKQQQQPKKSIHNLSLVRPAHWKEPEPLTEEEYKRIEEDCAGLI